MGIYLISYFDNLHCHIGKKIKKKKLESDKNLMVREANLAFS